MSAFRLVRDSLGFFSQVPIEDEPEELAVELAPEEEPEPETEADDLFASVIPKRRGRPRKDQ